VGKLMKLRRDGGCAGCGTPLAAGVSAYWFATDKVVRCVDCFAGRAVSTSTGTPTTNPWAAPDALQRDLTAAPATEPEVAPLTEPELAPGTEPELAPVTDRAGASAQREYEKRSARELAKKELRVAKNAEWRETVKAQRPVLGRVVSAFTPRPEITPESQPTGAWKVGAEGERRVAEVLAETSSIEVLHDRLVPGSRANIDHIVVGPSGVFVIDAKKYTGKIEVRNVGGVFRPDERLYVNDRDRTKVVEGVLGQIDVVRAVLGEGFADVEIRGVLCFVGCEWGWPMRMKHINGVTALWPKALPEHVSIPGDLGLQLAAVADLLRDQLRSAT
jgi:Nuclease-related domain